MARRLPPFAAIRSFEAVARQKSLQGAANELKVSASAISHQVKSLEEFLGCKLIIRSSNGMYPSEIGRAYQKQLSAILDQLEVATALSSQRREDYGVTVNSFHSFAELWLVPRLAGFLREHPDVHLRIVTDPEEAELTGSDIDVAFRYAPTTDPPPESELLLDEDILPVCSPHYHKQHLAAFKNFSDCANLKLIQSTVHPDEWTDWATGVGVEFPDVDGWIEFDTRSLVLQAAVQGMGIAMARRPYADDHFKKGTLISPFNKPYCTGFSYFLVVPERSRGLSQVISFCKWIRKTIKNRGPK